MLILLIVLVCIFISLGVCALAAISDVRSMVIPNVYSLYVILSFFVAYLCAYASGNTHYFSPVLSHLFSAVSVFVVTFFLFAARMLGAGDSKFATACSLWLGIRDLPVFIFYMAFVGGALGVYSLYLKKKKPFKNPRENSWIAQVQGGASKVPYGLAIAFGTFIAFIYSGYFDPEKLSGFLTT